MDETNTCNSCSPAPKESRTKGVLRFIPGFLLVVLPKCPFCFMAFSSSMVLCGEAGAFTSQRVHNSSLTIGVAALFCVLAIAGIALVYRDKRTRFALALAIAGCAMIMTSVLRTGGLSLYYTGSTIVLMAYWLNTSMLHVLRNAFTWCCTLIRKFSIVNQ